jgi:predicted peptidase
MMRVALVLALFALTSVAMAQPASAQLRVYKSGVHTDTFKRDGQPAVRYVISIPKGYSASSAVPLLLALHFAGNPDGAAMRLFDQLIEPALKPLGAIIVAPESLGGGWESAANDSAVMALLDAIQASYAVDGRRVAVTGYSLGGAGTWVYAARHPDRFSAAIPVAGRPFGSAGAWKTPVFVVHSRDDSVMPIEPTLARIKELQDKGVPVQFVELKGISHYETTRFTDGLKRAVPWLKDLWK